MSQTVTETVPPVETLHLRLQNPSQSQMVPHPPLGAKPKAKLRLDPHRALEPARKKLSTLEAQRIMAVLVESIRKIELVTALPEYILENIDRFQIMLGADLVQLLEDHTIIIKSFEELKSEAERLLQKEEAESAVQAEDEQDVEKEEDGEKEDEKEDEGQKEKGEKEEEADDDTKPWEKSDQREGSSSRASLRPDFEEYQGAGSRSVSRVSISSQADAALRNLALVAKQMQESCKNILREFSLNPSVMSTILKDFEDRNDPAQDMIDDLNEMKDILMGMLLTTPVEEAERNQYVQEVSERERYNAGVIAKLEAELAAAMEDKDTEIKKKNDVIRRLQSDLHQIERFSEEHIRRTKSEAEKQEAGDKKNSEGKKQKLTQDLNVLKQQLQNLVQEHRDEEQRLRKKKFQVETEVENWVQKYDEEMGTKQDEYEEIDAVYTEEKKQLNELEERFKTLEEEYTQIQEERRIARERQEADERKLLFSIQAATIIQAFWRSYKVRKALKAKKKKKKGGKKKK